MKRLALLLVPLFLIAGCTDSPSIPYSPTQEQRMEVTGRQRFGEADFYILKDRKTGEEYLLFWDGNNSCITKLEK